MMLKKKRNNMTTTAIFQAVAAITTDRLRGR